MNVSKATFCSEPVKLGVSVTALVEDSHQMRQSNSRKADKVVFRAYDLYARHGVRFLNPQRTAC